MIFYLQYYYIYILIIDILFKNDNNIIDIYNG